MMFAEEVGMFIWALLLLCLIGCAQDNPGPAQEQPTAATDAGLARSGCEIDAGRCLSIGGARCCVAGAAQWTAEMGCSGPYKGHGIIACSADVCAGNTEWGCFVRSDGDGGPVEIVVVGSSSDARDLVGYRWCDEAAVEIYSSAPACGQQGS